MIQYGMGLARKMLTVLADVDRALNNIDDDDQSPVAQGLRLLRNKMWHELSGDGVSAIEAKGNKFDPAKMEAITTIPASKISWHCSRCYRSRIYVQAEGIDSIKSRCCFGRLTDINS